MDTNISTLGDYYAEVGTTGDFYNFRMYLVPGAEPGNWDEPYYAEIKNYREGPGPPSPDVLTLYWDENCESHVFSNEPSIWLQAHE